MTLILSCLTPKYIVQVSDRRLTKPDGTVVDDSANKAIMFHERACFGYTGIAEIGPQRTDEWIADKLIGRVGIQDAINHLKKVLDETVCKLRAPNRYLTVVIDFWGTEDPDMPDQPWSIALSNMIDPQTRKCPAVPLPTFQQFNQKLPEGKGYAFLPLGQALDGGIYKKMVRNIVRAMRHAADTPTTIMPTTVGRFMREAILRVAKVNVTVGENMMMTVIFNRQHPENVGVSNLAMYLPSDKSNPVLYAPIIINPDMAIKGVKMYPGTPSWMKTSE